MVVPLIVQRAARSVSCGGVETLLNESAAWIRIMSSFTNGDDPEPAASQENAALLLIPAKASLQHLPLHNWRGAGNSIINNEMELSTFMRSAGLLTGKASNGETESCCDTPRAAGGSKVGSKRMVESSPTNVTEYLEVPFMSRLKDTESQIPFSFEGAASTRASKRKDAENQNKTRSTYCETNQISKKRQRDTKTDQADPLSSPARTNQRSSGACIFSPNRQQAASNLVDLRNGSSGTALLR